MTLDQRLLLVAGMAVATALIVLLLRRWPVVRSRQMDAGELATGVYLLTSADCDTCAKARARLNAAGASYTELAWNDQPDVFDRLGIDAVPSMLVVGEGGQGRWWRGVPRQIPRSGRHLG